jgi:hypothetical protein
VATPSYDTKKNEKLQAVCLQALNERTGEWLVVEEYGKTAAYQTARILNGPSGLPGSNGGGSPLKFGASVVDTLDEETGTIIRKSILKVKFEGEVS